MKILNLLFMGRGGIDELNKFLFVIYLIVWIVSWFIRNFFLDLFVVLLFVLMIYRMFSKNIYKRTRENRVFLNILNPIRKPFNSIKSLFKRNKISSSNCIYKKCPKCKQKLKLPVPKSIGIKHTTCPNCKNRFAFLALKRKK